MCTDGVSNMLTDDEILAILKEDSTEEDRVEKIIAMANENGGRDNMGIVFITL
jgi:protein phosphatase